MIQIDMPMPKCCDECFALDDHGDYPFCLISKDQRGYNFNAQQNRMPSCPLKAQEPRVLMLGGLRDIGSVWELNTPPYLWMEINPSYRWTRGFWVAWREIYDMIDGLHPTYDADNYGKIWRCWTSRPTDEQREATPWE